MNEVASEFRRASKKQMAETSKRTINENVRIEQTVNDMEDVSARLNNENEDIDDGVNALFSVTHPLCLLLEQANAREYPTIEKQRTTARLSTRHIGRGLSGDGEAREDRLVSLIELLAKI